MSEKAQGLYAAQMPKRILATPVSLHNGFLEERNDDRDN